MKKFYSLLSVILITGAMNAQQLNVTDLLFTTPSGSIGNPLNDTALEKGTTVKLWFKVENKLLASQDLMVGDSLTFGWSIDGSDQGSLIMNSLNNTIANGSVMNAYLTNNYVLPTTHNTNIEICTWPLYNPYAANTDPMVGRKCKSFKTKNETPDGNGGDTTATAVKLLNLNGGANFYVQNRSIEFVFNSENSSNSIELFNLTGKVIVSENVFEKEGSISVSSEVVSGFYLLRASTLSDSKIKKVYIK